MSGRNELERVQKEVFVDTFKTVIQQLPGKTNEILGNTSFIPVGCPTYSKSGTMQIQV
jgi:hypothetical protein